MCNDLAGQLAHRRMTAEVWCPHARGRDLHRRVIDRFRCYGPLRVLGAGGVVQERAAGEDHRHRVSDVLPLERRRGAVRRLGHHDPRLVLLV